MFNLVVPETTDNKTKIEKTLNIDLPLSASNFHYFKHSTKSIYIPIFTFADSYKELTLIKFELDSREFDSLLPELHLEESDHEFQESFWRAYSDSVIPLEMQDEILW